MTESGDRPWRECSLPLARGVLLIALMAESACHRSSASSPGARTFDSNGGHYQVVLVPTPDPIPRGQPFDVEVRITARDSNPGEPEVRIDARMPEHFHGMNRTAIMKRLDKSTWRGSDLLFHMPGHWELYVDITQNGRTERAQMDVDLK